MEESLNTSVSSELFKSIRIKEGLLLSSEAANQIRELIRSGELKKGDRLPSERMLGEKLGVSRTVIREAIKMLRAFGYLQSRVGVGTFVAEETINILEDTYSYSTDTELKKIRDLHQVREVLEPSIAALAAKNATMEDIVHLENILLEMEKNISTSSRYIEGDKLFHIAIAEASKNSVFITILNSIVDLLQKARQMAISTPGAGNRSNQYHRSIFEAIKKREAEKAFIAMTEHMQQTQKDINASLRRIINETYR